MPADTSPGMDRRTYLSGLAVLAGSGSLAGCFLLERGEDGTTTEMAGERARDLAERFAPTLYFDEQEKWYPTDPRLYTTVEEDESIVDGFAAFDGYTEAFKQSGEPPAPMVFYHAIKYVDSPLAVVQFWYYSAFDQFTTNFHWHDWEVLHVFVDTDTDEPQLYVASSHSGNIPNNEFLDPDADVTPRILSELGSHSSALSVNDDADRFRRFPFDGTFADITNSGLKGIEAIADFLLAYGLPRDEGTTLPFLVPELDGAPIYDHTQLPSVQPDDLITDDLTVRSFDDLLFPPATLSTRVTGLVFDHADRDTDADIQYELASSSEIEHIDEFTGPQLSFEFLIPDFAEDLIADHITTTGVPWDQSRYGNPAADISDPSHRSALAERYEAIGDPAPINSIFALVTETVPDEDAPEDEGVTTEASTVESVALLESEPTAVPTTGGVTIIQDVPEGEHRMTVNGPGVAPHSESIAVTDEDDEPSVAGPAGEIPLVAREQAMKLEVDTEGTDTQLTNLAIEDDFAGRLYDAPLSGQDAVYVHQGGAYTTEVRDIDDEIGAFRINPSDAGTVRIAEPRTGKASLAEYLADVAEETSAAVEAIEQDEDGGETGTGGEDGSGDGASSPVENLSKALAAIADAAHRAADRAAAGDRGGANERLQTVHDRLDRVETRLGEAKGNLPADLERAVTHRLDQLQTRSGQARAAGRL